MFAPPGCTSVPRSIGHSAPQLNRAAASSLRCHAAASPSSTAALLVQGPPEDFDFRAQIGEGTRTCISASHPELLDLVEEGSLVVWQRPASHTERRSDGYREPETVFLMGCAHVSSKSAADVRRVISAVQPDAVVVELCKGRTAIMNAPPGDQRQQQQQQQQGDQVDSSPQSSSQAAAASSLLPLSGSEAGAGSFLAALQRSMQLGGRSVLLLRLLLSNLGKAAAGQMGVQGGGEFVAAREAADSIGAQLVLGDRPIEITLQRAWEAMPWSRRLALCSELVQATRAAEPSGGKALLSQQLVERMQQDDAVSAFFRQLALEYPELLGPLVHERDMYLAWSLKRSKAVCGARAVVGVVGRGHLRGVVYALSHDSGALRFSDLVGGMNNRSARRKQALRGAAKLALETAAFTALYLAWVSFTEPGV